MRRLARGVTSESHPLYGEFLWKLSYCIFEWDSEDVDRLKVALCEVLKQAGITNPTSTAIKRRLTKRDVLNHCKRRTRGTDETIANIESLILSLSSATDVLGVPLFRDHNHLGRTEAPCSVPARSNRHPTLHTDWSHPERWCSPAHLQMCQGEHLTRELPLASSKVNQKFFKYMTVQNCTYMYTMYSTIKNYLFTYFIHVGLYQALQQVMFIIRLDWWHHKMEQGQGFSFPGCEHSVSANLRHCSTAKGFNW